MVSDFIFHLRDNLAYLRDVKTTNWSFIDFQVLYTILYFLDIDSTEHETITKRSCDILSWIEITMVAYLCCQAWAHINKMRIEILTYVSFICINPVIIK